MNHSRYPLAALVLAMATLALSAEEAPPRRVLVLTNEATLVGRIEAKNGHFEVRTESGTSQIPASRVLQLCESPEDAYRFLKQRVNRNDPLDCLRLARWCVKQGLTQQAEAEAKETLRLQPMNLEAQRIVKAASGTASTSETQAPSSTKLTPAAQEHSYSPEALRTFAQKVQPMLVNSCGTGACHGGAKGAGFELLRPAANGPTPPSLTRQNLVQTLKLIDKEDSSNSPLLRKALEAHGGHAKPPLMGKDAPAYQTLEAWVLKTAPAKETGSLGGEIVAVSTRSQEDAPERVVADPLTTPRLPSALEEKFAARTTPVDPPSPGPAEKLEKPRTIPSTIPAAPLLPKPKSEPQDPFDPIQFNEVHHPQKK